jgi:hypothetical protein
MPKYLPVAFANHFLISDFHKILAGTGCLRWVDVFLDTGLFYSLFSRGFVVSGLEAAASVNWRHVKVSSKF